MGPCGALAQQGLRFSSFAPCGGVLGTTLGVGGFVRSSTRRVVALATVALSIALVCSSAGATTTSGATLSLSTAKKVTLGASVDAHIVVRGLDSAAVVVGSLLHASGSSLCGDQTARTWAGAAVVKSVTSLSLIHI